ncbi:hypothetical protein [Methylomagnum sp.]
MILKLCAASKSVGCDLFRNLSEIMARHPRAGRCLRFALYGAGAGLVCLAALLALAFEDQPWLAPDSQPAHHYLAKTRTLIRDTVRTGPTDTNRKKLVLTADDLTAAANFALLRKRLEGRAVCAIDDRRLNLTASIRLRDGDPGLFLNLKLIIDDSEPQARIKRLKLGRLTLPAPFVGWLARGVLHYTPMARYSRIGERLVEEVHVRDGRLAVSVNWNRNVLAQAEGLMDDLADRERLLVYQDKLAELVAQPNIKRFVRLGTLMQPLFALAKSRADDGGDPVAENRALIVVLAAYVNGKNLALGAPIAAEPARRDVLLNRRIDTAQHFMGSASLAMTGHRALADVIGLAKEMHDTHDGSGFSFIDLAADQAGALFGKLAVHSGDEARKVQRILSQGAEESRFMPAVKDLPENLAQDEFTDRFKDIESPEFQAMKSQIEARILARPLYSDGLAEDGPPKN